MFKKILCALDGSDHALKAQELAIDLARLYGAELILQHVMLIHARAEQLERFARIEGLAPQVQEATNRLRSVEGRLEYGYQEPPAGSRVFADIGQRLLDEAAEDAREKGVAKPRTILSDGDAADRILEAAETEGADAVVMGSRGLSDARAMFLGSVSHKVTNRAPCTVISVK
ncbi:MAG: universal stress protein [Pseudomonadota bacterium]